MNKVIIWGHKLHSHTHSYIHGAVFKAFKDMGYETYWLDNSDDISNINFDDCFFFTEGQVDSGIPINKKSKYILHNCDLNKYQNVNYIQWQVYTNGKEKSLGVSGEKIDTCIYYDQKGKILYQPWATDLLKQEIKNSYEAQTNKNIIWVGSIWGSYHGNDTELKPFVDSAQSKGYRFDIYSPGKCTFEENYNLIKNSELAPAIVGRWQKVNGYIPCRIFKNISYGKLGVTNSKEVYDLLDENVIYHEDPSKLIELYENTSKEKQIKCFSDSLNLVKTKHTYSNRLQTILSFL
jgi:hypothetical protein